MLKSSNFYIAKKAMTGWVRNAGVLCFSVIYFEMLTAVELRISNTEVNKIIGKAKGENINYKTDSSGKINKTESSQSYLCEAFVMSNSSIQIHPSNRTIHHDNNKKLDFKILITIPLGIVLLIIFIIVLVFLIRRRLRKRQLQREFLPQYSYDHSEAEIFDGYSQYPEGVGSVERLVYENSRLKTTSPTSMDKSEISIEVDVIPNGNAKQSETVSSGEKAT